MYYYKEEGEDKLEAIKVSYDPAQKIKTDKQSLGYERIWRDAMEQNYAPKLKYLKKSRITSDSVLNALMFLTFGHEQVFDVESPLSTKERQNIFGNSLYFGTRFLHEVNPELLQSIVTVLNNPKDICQFESDTLDIIMVTHALSESSSTPITWFIVELLSILSNNIAGAAKVKIPHQCGDEIQNGHAIITLLLNAILS